MTEKGEVYSSDKSDTIPIKWAAPEAFISGTCKTYNIVIFLNYTNNRIERYKPRKISEVDLSMVIKAIYQSEFVYDKIFRYFDVVF